LANPAQREFSSKDKGSNRVYIEHRFKYCEEHNMESRLQALEITWNPDIVEQLDQDSQRACRYAAKQCKHNPNVAYVKKLSALRIKKNVLLRVITQFKTGRNLSDAIEFQVREGHDFTIPETVKECQRECRRTQRQIKALEKDSATHRRNDLVDAKKKAENSGDKKAANAIRNIIVAEQTATMYRKLKFARGIQKTGLSRLEVPRDQTERDYKACTDWITIDVPKEIEQKLLERNQFHFGQADGTHPTIPPFSEWIDWGASTHQAELILEGNFTSDEISDLANDLQRHMQKRADLDSITDILSVEEWIGKIVAWKESTSTSPSGFHLTHSKALVAKHDLSLETPEGAALETKRLQLIDWQVRLLNIAIKHAYSFKRWQTIVNVMILKEPGNDKIHRLRVLHIYQHDYNLILAVKWRQLIYKGTFNRTLNAGQFGAVPGRDAVTPTVIEELQYEISRASKRPLIHKDHDATACYDRIIMNLSSLISRAYGQHRSIVIINAKTLKEAIFILKTTLGISEASYKHCQVFPICGCGQGAGNSPGIWCVISSVMFDLYEEKAHGAQFESPDGTYTARVYMIGFVDDTSGSVNDFNLPEALPPSHYAELATQDAQRWSDILQLTGGALEDTKCSYHFLYYDFTITGLPVLRGGKFDPKI
jgi:hypothetical protein